MKTETYTCDKCKKEIDIKDFPQVIPEEKGQPSTLMVIVNKLMITHEKWFKHEMIDNGDIHLCKEHGVAFEALKDRQLKEQYEWLNGQG
jgi:protein-arginine kinase activator protein McsA